MRLLLAAVGCTLILGLPQHALALTIDLDYAGNTVAGGPHDAFHGEFDVTDANIVNGNFGPGGSSVIGDLGGAGTPFLDEVSSEATQAQYDALFPSDDIWLQTANPGWFDNAFVQFVFQTGLTPADLPLVESVFFSVEGRQGDPDTDDWYIYLWDFSQGRYLRLSNWCEKDPDEVQDATLIAGFLSGNGYTLGAAGDLIDPVSGQLIGLVVNQDTNDWLRIDTTSVSIEVIPEPDTALLLALGLAGLGTARRARR